MCRRKNRNAGGLVVSRAFVGQPACHSGKPTRPSRKCPREQCEYRKLPEHRAVLQSQRRRIIVVHDGAADAAAKLITRQLRPRINRRPVAAPSGAIIKEAICCCLCRAIVFADVAVKLVRTALGHQFNLAACAATFVCTRIGRNGAKLLNRVDRRVADGAANWPVAWSLASIPSMVMLPWSAREPVTEPARLPPPAPTLFQPRRAASRSEPPASCEPESGVLSTVALQ